MANFLQHLKKRLNNIGRYLNKFFSLTKQEKNLLKDLKIKSVENLPEDAPAGMRLNQAAKALEQLENKGFFDKLDLKKIAGYFLKEKEGKFMLKAFRDTSGNINRCDDLGNTIFTYALPSESMLKALIESYKADVNAKDGRGATLAFYISVAGKKNNFLNYLHKKGADFNITDLRGNTILHTIIRDHAPQSNRDLSNNFEYMLKHGVDPMKKNQEGKTALDLARERNKEDLIKAIEAFEKNKHLKQPENKRTEPSLRYISSPVDLPKMNKNAPQSNRLRLRRHSHLI